MLQHALTAHTAMNKCTITAVHAHNSLSCKVLPQMNKVQRKVLKKSKTADDATAAILACECNASSLNCSLPSFQSCTRVELAVTLTAMLTAYPFDSLHQLTPALH